MLNIQKYAKTLINTKLKIGDFVIVKAYKDVCRGADAFNDIGFADSMREYCGQKMKIEYIDKDTNRGTLIHLKNCQNSTMRRPWMWKEQWFEKK